MMYFNRLPVQVCPVVLYVSLQLRITELFFYTNNDCFKYLHCFIVASNAFWYLWFGDSHSLCKHEYDTHG